MPWGKENMHIHGPNLEDITLGDEAVPLRAIRRECIRKVVDPRPEPLDVDNPLSDGCLRASPVLQVPSCR
jgi:hypothetical protein